MKYFGGIEAGGTKFVCVVTDDGKNILAETRFPTTTPGETLGRVIEFFQAAEPASCPNRSPHLAWPVLAPSIQSHASPKFGYITTTPKAGLGEHAGGADRCAKPLACRWPSTPM